MCLANYTFSPPIELCGWTEWRRLWAMLGFAPEQQKATPSYGEEERDFFGNLFRYFHFRNQFNTIKIFRWCWVLPWKSKMSPLTSEGLKYPPEVRVRHETCSTICGTHVQAILDQKNLTGLAGGVREGQNMAHLGHFNGKCAQMQNTKNAFSQNPRMGGFWSLGI